MLKICCLFISVILSQSIEAAEQERSIALEPAISKQEHDALLKQTESAFALEVKTCNQSKAPTKICLLKAQTKKTVAEANLKAKLNPTLENQVDARIAAAEAAYQVNVELCAEKSAKQECVNTANLAKDEAIAKARAFTKSSGQ